jgi:antitoxin (DNA-binding transcriptional repressor) of toxin-antitoxin stability system
MLRQLRSSAHVGAAVARLIAAQQPASGEQYTGSVTTTPKPRDEQTPKERARRDAETDEILRKIKEGA